MDRLQAMKIFERVVEEGGFAAAARAMDMSPPVVTRMVAELEQHLGTRLLQRTTRKLALTEAGQAAFARAAALIGSGEMAFAYFTEHQPHGFWPLQNGGELAVLYCFSLLLIAFAGAGAFAPGARLRR